MIFTSSFVVGSAVGAISTYIYKDDAAKAKVSEAALKIKSGISDIFKKKEAVSEELAESADTVSESASDAAEVVKETVAGNRGATT